MKFKRKKVQKYRGSKTHGCGSMKKRRGAGHRGGRGRSGSGKRGDQKKPSYWKDKREKGFNSLMKRKTTITLQDLMRHMEKNKIDTINLSELGYDKLLGNGTVDRKVNITAKYATERAIEKVNDAGGTLEVTNKKIKSLDKA